MKPLPRSVWATWAGNATFDEIVDQLSRMDATAISTLNTLVELNRPHRKLSELALERLDALE
jgi:hypothetical protein